MSQTGWTEEQVREVNEGVKVSVGAKVVDYAPCLRPRGKWSWLRGLGSVRQWDFWLVVGECEKRK